MGSWARGGAVFQLTPYCISIDPYSCSHQAFFLCLNWHPPCISIDPYSCSHQGFFLGQGHGQQGPGRVYLFGGHSGVQGPCTFDEEVYVCGNRYVLCVWCVTIGVTICSTYRNCMGCVGHTWIGGWNAKIGKSGQKPFTMCPRYTLSLWTGNVKLL